MDQFITTAEAARILDVQPRRIRQLIESKELPGHKVGRDWIVSREAVYERKRRVRAGEIKRGPKPKRRS